MCANHPVLAQILEWVHAELQEPHNATAETS
jgi:hypothetical protein